MNKKIILSLSVIGIVAAMVVGGTYAYFSQTVTSTDNTFSAGTMTMKLNNIESDTVGPALTVSNMYPGSFVQSAAMITAGDIALNPELKLSNASGDTEMVNYLFLEIWTNGKLWYSDYIKNFPGYSTTKKVILDTIPAGESQYVAFRVIMVETAPDSLQSKTYSVNVVVTGHQWNNPDYQPSSPVAIDPTGYVASSWSYNVCGVRQPKFWTPLLATDTYVARGYDYTKYSPFFSYRVAPTMVDTNSMWMIKGSGPSDYAGGTTNLTDGSCKVK